MKALLLGLGILGICILFLWGLFLLGGIVRIFLRNTFTSVVTKYTYDEIASEAALAAVYVVVIILFFLLGYGIGYSILNP
jgi:hypothetical protein